MIEQERYWYINHILAGHMHGGSELTICTMQQKRSNLSSVHHKKCHRGREREVSVYDVSQQHAYIIPLRKVTGDRCLVICVLHRILYFMSCM